MTKPQPGSVEWLRFHEQKHRAQYAKWGLSSDWREAERLKREIEKRAVSSTSGSVT